MFELSSIHAKGTNPISYSERISGASSVDGTMRGTYQPTQTTSYAEEIAGDFSHKEKRTAPEIKRLEAAERMKSRQCSPYFKPAEQFQLLGAAMTEDARRVIRNEYKRHAIAVKRARGSVKPLYERETLAAIPPGLRGKP